MYTLMTILKLFTHDTQSQKINPLSSVNTTNVHFKQTAPWRLPCQFIQLTKTDFKYFPSRAQKLGSFNRQNGCPGDSTMRWAHSRGLRCSEVVSPTSELDIVDCRVAWSLVPAIQCGGMDVETFQNIREVFLLYKKKFYKL